MDRPTGMKEGGCAKTFALMGQAFAEEALHIARESTTSTTALDRVLIDTLKWAAAKANPSEYGEKQTVEHQGAQTLQVRIVEDDAPLRNPKAAEQFKQIAEAHGVLSDPEKRKQYDTFGATNGRVGGAPGGPNVDFSSSPPGVFNCPVWYLKM